MDQYIGKSIFELQEKVLFQPETEQLRKEYQYYNEKIRDCLDQVTEELKEVILGYVGAVIELYMKMLELAVQ